MLTPEQLAHCADDAVALYSRLNEEIVRDIARRIAKSSRLTETGRLQILALQDVGMLTSDIQKTVSRYSGASETLLHDLFEDAGIMSVEYDMSIYTANGLNPLPLNMSLTVLRMMRQSRPMDQCSIYSVSRRTTSSKSVILLLPLTCHIPVMPESGAFSPQQAIVDAVKQIAKEGAVIRYPSGHKDKLDVAVRRNVMTGIGQTTGEICLGYARELNHDLMEITAHAGARPSHAKWQGQIVSLRGKPGSDIGYGTGEGFKGYNCRHDWYPYFEGSRRMYSPEELEKLNAKDIQFPDGSMHTLYEAEQYQRACERKIRETKRILAAQNEFIVHTDSKSMKRAMQKDFDKRAIVLKRQEAQLKYFSETTGLRVNTSRTQKYGFGRSAAQRASASANRHYKKWSKEHNINNIKTLAEYYNVKYNDKQRYSLLKQYTKSIETGMLSPLTGFDKYEEYHARVQTELFGITTANGITVNSQSLHFLERVFGTKEDTKTLLPRNGVTLEDIRDALISDRKPRYSRKNNSYVFVNDKCQVSVNPNGNLIQTNPK